MGTNVTINARIAQLAAESPQNNTIIITNGKEHLLTEHLSFYHTNRCGIIENVTIHEVDAINKIIMLSDERILCFDELCIV